MDQKRPLRRPPDQASSRPAPGRRRARPSRRTFIIRRIVALGLAIAIMAVIVSVARSIVGGDTSTASGTTLSSSDGLDVTSTAAVPGLPTDPALIDPNTATTALPTTLPTTPDPGTVPTPADPARVLLVGDSEAGGLAPFLGKVLKATGLTTLTVDYKVSSGLVRPDFFDWPAHLRDSVPGANPDIVVALFGGNDGQGFLGTDAAAGAAAGKSVDSGEWRAEYGRRVGEVMDFLAGGGRTLVWVGVPNGQDPGLTANLKVQNEVVTAEAAKRPKVIFVNSWNSFTGIDGGFAPYVVDPRDGVSKPVRSEKDGFHLNTVGEEILAKYVGDAIIGELRVRGAAV